ncbi:TetR/AcrR family transcriptional regulator [Leucobacter allii]|uniref:TetR/AcrR family transcriptional regulator n=1 Tax=Leucobacter allii TaxID=2932247 RepID=UPI001FD203D1|nr:TetR/AcrR family transcriptional regulator [Leucobacter allii]UOR00474.1 TetR/AcrR family transcriptional regulator [Leucobacter allii]
MGVGAEPRAVGSAARVPSLRERRRVRTRAEIVEAVLAVIAEAGEAELTIGRVTAASGVSRGTVYAYFPDGRDELLRAAYARLGERLVGRTRQAVAEAHDWRERLAAHAAALFELAADERIGRFYNVTGPALVAWGPERGIGSGASVEMMQEAISAAQAEGGIDPAVDAAETAVLLVGALRESAIRVADGSGASERAYAGFRRLVDGLAARS